MNLNSPTPEVSQPISSTDAIRELIAKPNSLVQEFLVRPEFTIDQIKQLVDGRFAEVAFTEDRGSLWVNEVVNTGTFRWESNYDGLAKRMERGRLVSHTHPKNIQQSYLSAEGMPWLSWMDIWNTMEEFNPKAKYILFHPQGGLEYTNPEPIKKLRPKPGQIGAENRKILTAFSLNTGVNVHIYPHDNPECGATSVYSVSRDEQLRLAKEFTDVNHMIVQSSTWDEKGKIQKLVDKINLQ